MARSRTTVERIAAETQGIAVICGTVTPAEADSGKKAMNSAALLRDGRIDFIQSKMLLPTYDVFDEMRNFAPAKSQQLFSFCGKQMALTICEDAWNDKRFWNRRLYGVDPVEELVRAGGNFVLNISASPFWLGKRELRHDMLAAIAQESESSGRDGEPGRGQRQPGFRRIEPGDCARWTGNRASQVLRGRPDLFRLPEANRRHAPTDCG